MLVAIKFLKGIWKSVVVLCGVIGGCLVYYGIWEFPGLENLQDESMSLSLWSWPWKWDLGAVLSFVFCFIALVVNELGSIQAVGRMVGADRMQRRSVRGVGITGIANMLAGMIGVVGPVDYSMSPGIIAATGCASRYPLIPAGVGLLLCDFCTSFIQLLSAIPGVVMGTVLLYLMASQLSAGLQMLTAEKAVFDYESGLVIGFSLMIALFLSFVPEEVLNTIPALLRPVIGNGFVMGVITVLILEHGVFRKSSPIRP